MKKLLLAACLLASSMHAISQTKISGNVRGKDGPLPNVTVAIKGTDAATVTKEDGSFAITIPAGNAGVLQFSFVGYTTREVPVKDKTSLDVLLVEDNAHLSDVIVVGYGTQRKSQLTGAIASVSSKEISELPVSSAQEALQGRVAGMDIVKTDNKPGSQPSVIIRGRRSFNAGNDPLYVVDGIPLVGGIGDFNPQDFESIEVLKDASATAIYGSRGANGVILISTRRGKIGKAVINYDAYYGLAQKMGRIEMMNGAQFAEYKRESRRATGNYPDIATDAADQKLFEAVELASIKLHRSTDYQSLLLRTGSRQSHQLAVSGGNDRTLYAVSGNLFTDKGIVYNQDYLRYSLRLSIDHQLSNHIKIGAATFFIRSTRNGEGFNPIGGALEENPLGVPYDSTGKMIFLPTSDGLRTNPVAEIVPGAIIDERVRKRMFTSIYGELKLAEGLTYRLNFGADLADDRYGQFTGSQTNARRGGDPTGRTQNFSNGNYTWENIIHYKALFNKVHSVDFTGLQAIQYSRDEYYDIRVRGIPVEQQSFYNLGAATIVEGVGSNLTEWKLQSFMGRINYALKEKYLLTLTGRMDGSSRLAPGNRYSFFPSIALGWDITRESFMERVRFFNRLKLRASYGFVGNQAIRPYQTQGSLARTTYSFGNNGAFGYRQNELANPNLKWERSKAINLGLDFSVFSSRLYGSVDVYQTNTTDLLLSRQLPITGGFTSITENIGATRNTGIEVNVSVVNINRPNGLKWTTDLNFFSNKEEIVELYNGKKDDVGNAWFIGQPLAVYYDYKKIGIWQNADKDLAAKYGQKPGEIRVLDRNGDGKITSDDRVILGSDVPKWSGGITNRFEYKGFDFNFFIYARIGGMIRSRFHDNYNHLAGRYNNLNVNYWTPNNPTNEFPRPNQNQEDPIYSSSMTYFDASFIKVRNISLGYNFSPRAAANIKMRSLRVYVSVQQPFIFAEYRSKYKGIDPEGARSISADAPATRLYDLGINARF